MRRALQVSSMAVAGVGLALWFFGGMNTGPSQWTEEAHDADAAHAVANEKRHVFRPGLGFLGAMLGTGAVLLGASFACNPAPRQQTD